MKGCVLCFLLTRCQNVVAPSNSGPGVLRGYKATNSPCPKYVKPLQGLSTRKSNDSQKKKKYNRWKLYISNHTNRQALHINNTSETATKTVHLTTNLKTIPRFLSGSNDLHRFRSRTSQMPKTSPTLGSMTFNTSSWVFLDHAGPAYPFGKRFLSLSLFETTKSWSPFLTSN